MNDSRCGECTMCCKLIEFASVEGETQIGTAGVKAAGKWCSLCKKGAGCSVFASAERPNACTSFECFWLKSQETEHPLPMSLRPDQIGAVTVIQRKGLEVVVNPTDISNKPWRKPGLLRKMIQAWDEAGLAVSLRCGHYTAAVSRSAIRALNLGGRGKPTA